MKKRFNLLVPFLLVVVLSFTGCLTFSDSCKHEVTYIKPVPVYKSLEEIRTPITVSEAKTMNNIGKIYYYNDYLLINEIREGIHIINNSDPRNPQKVAFINIQGNIDLAVKQNILYADSYIDLLAIDISNIENPTLVSRLENIFPSIHEQDGKFLVAQKGEMVTENVNCDMFISANPDIWLIEDSSDPSIGGAISGSDVSRALASGISGSMARIVTKGNYIYALHNQSLQIVDISNAATPSLSNTVSIVNGVETVFPHENYLFMGANNGMYIYDNSNPSLPSYLSNYEHIRSCDPVVVQGDFAYVTVRNGRDCGGWLNQLDVVNISNINNPTVVNEVSMSNPHGLSVLDKDLFVCDGTNGFKVFDVETASTPTLVSSLSNFQAYDVIAVPSKPLLLIVGKDGLRQYERSNPDDLKLLSVLAE
ncbi:MAG: LVIVD repeat-containing protein [Chitinophagales bacterium]